jgi:hypothetical protein
VPGGVAHHLEKIKKNRKIRTQVFLNTERQEKRNLPTTPVVEERMT